MKRVNLSKYFLTTLSACLVGVNSMSAVAALPDADYNELTAQLFAVGTVTNLEADILVEFTIDPLIRLQQIGGTDPEYIWDLVGSHEAFSVRDRTLSTPGNLVNPLQILPGVASDNFADRSIVASTESGNPAKRQVLQLINNGPVRFSMQDSSAGGTTWDFLKSSSGFTVSLVGSGGAEFKVNDDGSAQIGPGGVKNFDLAANGNLTIKGVLSQNSDVNAKENIRSVEDENILAKLEKLPVSRWNYKDDDASSRHLGPMAQDFYAAFGLGSSDKHIATLDTSGVALAAIKELHAEAKAKDEHIRKLEKRLQEMDEKLAFLLTESRLQSSSTKSAGSVTLVTQ